MNPFVLESSALVAAVLGLSGAGMAAIPRLPVNLKELRKSGEQGFDSLIVTEYLIAPGITFNEDGAFTTGWRLRGPDATTKTEGALDRMVGDWNAALSCTEQGWMYEFQRVRQPSKLSAVVDPDVFQPSPTHRVLADVRDTVVCEDEVRLLVTYLPPGEASRTIANWLINDTRPEKARDAIMEGLASLEEGCRQIETTLKSCMVEVERFFWTGGRHDELVDTLYRNINGWHLPGIALPYLETDGAGLLRHPLPLREILAVQDFDGGMDLQYGREHIRCISIVEFPSNRQPRMLAELASLAIPYRDHSRFIVASHQEMTHELTERANDARDDATNVQVLPNKKNSRRASEKAIAKRSLDKDALDRLKDLRKVKASHQNGTRKHSWYSHIIELRSEDLDQLEEWTSAICEVLRTAPHGGFGTRIEEMHGAEAWLSTLGGNGYNFVRGTPAHGVTVGDISNLTDAWRGRERVSCDKCPPNTPPMLWARRADTLAPFAVDLHAGDVMSCVVLGPIGWGKTTLVNALVIGHSQKTTRDRVVGVDYHRSEERAAVMADGAYGYPGEADSPARLCLFLDLDTVRGRTRSVEICVFILQLDTGENVKGDVKKKIVEAVDFLASDPDWRDHACTTIFLQKLSAEAAVRDAFGHYAAGGIYGHIYDATPNEMLGWQRPIRVYDTTALHSMGDAGALPALMILCADAEREMDGRRLILIIEEAEIALKHKLLRPWLIELLQTTRKKHLGIVFVIPDMQGIDEKTLKSLKGLCGTVFATENPNAEATRDEYRFMGFSDAQIDAIIPSRNPSLRHDGLDPLRFKYWQLGSDGIAPFVLDLSPPELEAWAKGSDADKAITAAALRDHPDETPAAIFEAVGEYQAAADWRAQRLRMRAQRVYSEFAVADSDFALT